MTEKAIPPGPCGDPNCDDGYVFEPPLQDGALGVSRPCSQCKANWQRYYEGRGEEREENRNWFREQGRIK